MNGSILKIKKNAKSCFEFKSASGDGTEERAVAEVIKVWRSRKRRQQYICQIYIHQEYNTADYILANYIEKVESGKVRCIDLQAGPKLLKISD